MGETYSFEAVLAAAKRANWQIDDIIGDDKRLDFARPFLPDSLARVEPLACLGEGERLALNHIRAHGYLCLFGLVEEFILPFVEDFADAADDGDDGDDVRVQALRQFASEEAKHIRLFERFRKEFLKGFGTPCAVIGPAKEIGRAVPAHHPLGVALAILHIEWMTQRHYVESVKSHRTLDPQFKSLLKHHWMEEAQHAKLDTLIVEELAHSYGDQDRERATLDYFKIMMLLDDGLAQQAELDVEALTLVSGSALSERHQRWVMAQQHQAMRWTFIGSGMTHPSFLATLQRVRPEAAQKAERMASVFF